MPTREKRSPSQRTTAGSFVTCRKNDLGIGSLLEVDRGVGLVEYFDSITASHQAMLAMESLDVVSPPAGTPCYWETDSGWFIGKIHERLNDGAFSVVSGEQIQQVPTAALRVRWARPIMLGGFVRVAGSLDGVGRLVEVDGPTARVEYFVSPVGPTFELKDVRAVDVQPYELPAQTLIYWNDPTRQEWRLGRVNGGLVNAAALRADEDHYDVRLPNDEDRRLPNSQVYVRWAHPIADPTELLAARVTESPFFAVGRQRLLDHLAKQRAAFGGLTGLAGAAIEHHAHQLAVVRRVLSDPIQRYLLADEVGLGKTIEAGILIRQHLVETGSTARVLILVPEHLCQQWRDELATRFALRGHERVAFLSHEELLPERITRLATPTLLVVDEAHRVARWAWSGEPDLRTKFECVETMARLTPRILLLSGTPLLHEEDGFLAMLHLLDPDGYPLTDRAPFRRRVEERQAVADSILDLADDAASLFAKDAIGRLERAFPDDTQLSILTSQLRPHVDEDLSSSARQKAIRDLRSYVIETFRLHRRLLRTRREDRNVVPLLPRRVGIEWLECSDPAREICEAFLEDWRLSLPGAALTADRRDDEPRLFALMVDAALSHPVVLLRLLEQRCRLLGGHAASAVQGGNDELLARPAAFQDEKQLLGRSSADLRAVLDAEPRVAVLHDWFLRQRIPRGIVFVDDPEVAGRVAERLKKAGGSALSVLRLVASEPILLHKFREDERSILVCDRRSEEGLNLQGTPAAVVFYDLPLEPARLEQRLGRVDRLEGMSRLRLTGFRGAGPYEQQWQECLTETIRLFHRSIAPLQYVLAEATRRIRSEFASSGPGAIEQEASTMRAPSSGLDVELRRIRSQEALEALEWDADEERRFVERVRRASEAATLRGGEAFGAWLERCVQYGRRGADVFHFVHRLRGQQPTLVPVGDTMERFGKFRNDAVREHRDEIPIGPFTFVADAVQEGISLLRIGHSFVDALEEMVRLDCRGTAWVFWRHAPELSLPAPRLFFNFNLVFDTDLSIARRILDPARVDAEAIRRQGDTAFPTAYFSAWMRADGQAETSEAILTCLRRPYSSPKQGGRDLHVRGERWLQVEESYSTADWQERCLAARRSAEAWVRALPDFTSRCQRAAKIIRTRFGARETLLQSRLIRLQGSALKAERAAIVQDRELSEALASGAEKPVARLDAAGAVFVSPVPLLFDVP